MFERGTCQVDSGTRANSNIFFRPQFLVRKQLAKIWKVPHFGGGQIKTTCLTRTLLIDMSYIHKAITYLKSTLQRKTLLSRVPRSKLLASQVTSLRKSYLCNVIKFFTLCVDRFNLSLNYANKDTESSRRCMLRAIYLESQRLNFQYYQIWLLLIDVMAVSLLLKVAKKVRTSRTLLVVHSYSNQIIF